MHIHIPDGVLPIWFWGSGYLVTFVFLAITLYKTKKDIKKIPLTAMMVAVMLIVMSIPLGIPFHINLSVFSGLMVGMYFSLIASFVVNLILASFGHGGLTIVGLNTIILWFEAIIGILLFKTLHKLSKNYFMTASISTFFALVCSAFLVIGAVAISTVNPAEFLHHHKEMERLQVSLPTFILITLPIAVIGAALEALITGSLVQYIRKIKPDLLERGK
ncbi:MAG: energy-coupling factor ABC transporter permease [Candidatus Aenigmarchaeota archaeon]|nr:energy-coupling factor ABC transporter permease [Candidatus Aenigmarchaeota archaeon]